MWRPFPLFPILSLFFFTEREIWIPPKVSVVSRCVFRGEGVTLFFWCLGVCCTNGLDFLFCFFDLTIDDGMGPKLCLMDGWEKDDMCLKTCLAD